MERHPLDSLLVEESYEKIIQAKSRLEMKLSAKYELPMLGLGKAMVSRLRDGKIDEDEDIIAWQCLNEAWLDALIETEA